MKNRRKTSKARTIIIICHRRIYSTVYYYRIATRYTRYIVYLLRLYAKVLCFYYCFFLNNKINNFIVIFDFNAIQFLLQSLFLFLFLNVFLTKPNNMNIYELNNILFIF